MADILSQVSAIVTESVEWINAFVNCIVAQPLLLLFVVTGFVGLGVGLIKRLMRI